VNGGCITWYGSVGGYNEREKFISLNPVCDAPCKPTTGIMGFRQGVLLATTCFLFGE
jgi:hypothetical protein